MANCVRVFNVVWPILVHEDSGFCCSISELRTPCQFSFLKIFDIDLVGFDLFQQCIFGVNLLLKLIS